MLRIHPILRFPICLLVSLICLFGMSRPLAPPHHDLSVNQLIWYWEGGAQLDHSAFVDVIAEVIEAMPIVPYRQDLIRLLTETAATESSFGQVVRDRSGKTLGVYQILLTTAEYLLTKLRDDHPHVVHIVEAYMDPNKSLAENLMYNLHFQTAMAISYYWLRAGDDLLGQTSTLDGRARLYKREWNTLRGKATEAKYIRDSKRYLVSNR
ncbi:MAG: hypothetical protein LBC10_02850 [Deltaproteobacteria bacterium]|jgi:hypothetical protein|nr:hypothetical protein [Deltaproteobacteria bacterium]